VNWIGDRKVRLNDMKLMVLLIPVVLFIAGCASNEAEPTETALYVAWTAPGDDGMMGQASEYDLRWSGSADSLANHWASCNVIPTGAPSPSGDRDSVVVTLQLESGKPYYFAIKTADEVPNWSGISNVFVLNVADTEAPLEVNNLVVGPVGVSRVGGDGVKK